MRPSARRRDALRSGRARGDAASRATASEALRVPLDGQEALAVATAASSHDDLAFDFDDSGWASISRDLAEGRFAGDREEYLHQRALALAAHPDFDTLLSLQLITAFTPFDYQLAAAKQVLGRMRGRAILADEVGLGKTIEAGLVISEYLVRGLAKKVLILCPQPLVAQWAEEMRFKFGLDFALFDDLEFQKHPRPWAAFDRIIAPLDSAKREPHRSRILEVFFDCVVVDEAHRCRNRFSLSWRLVNELKKKYILLLTATPVQNDLEDLYNLITLLKPGQLATATSFRRTYVSKEDRFKPRNVERLRELTREVMIRTRRSTAGISLPPRRADTIVVRPSEEERAFYEGISDYVRAAFPKDGGGGARRLALKTLQREAGSSPQAALSSLQKMAAAATDDEKARLASLADMGFGVPFSKGEALIELLLSLGDRKVIVFTGFRRTQEALLALCARSGIRAVGYHGEMRRQQKEDAVGAFAGEVPVLISTESGGEGRNLQFCHTMVNFDLPWNPMRIEQRIGRLHRIGQTKEVQIYNLSASGTIEDHLLRLLDAKINLFELVVGELDAILGNLADERDFEDILMEAWVRSRTEQELAESLNELGERLAEAKKRYLESRSLDLAVTG